MHKKYINNCKISYFQYNLNHFSIMSLLNLSYYSKNFFCIMEEKSPVFFALKLLLLSTYL